jgi:hypothetical protein
MRALFRTLLWVAILFALALALNAIPPLDDFTRALEQHPEPYKTIAIVVSIVGWGILLLAFVIGFVLSSRPMSDQDARAFLQRTTHQRVRGPAAGREFHIDTTFREIKQAARTGEWLRNPRWYPIFLGLAALPLIAYGMFGFFIVVGPPVAQVLCAAALLYATVRTLWSFWKA